MFQKVSLLNPSDLKFTLKGSLETLKPASVSPVFASSAPPPSSPEDARKPSVLEQFMPIVFILLIAYFLLIRPAQKRNQRHVEFTKNLKKGDSVLTSGGILGKIEGLTDQYVILEVSEKVKIRVLRQNISSFSEASLKTKNSKDSSGVVKK